MGMATPARKPPAPAYPWAYANPLRPAPLKTEMPPRVHAMAIGAIVGLIIFAALVLVLTPLDAPSRQNADEMSRQQEPRSGARIGLTTRGAVPCLNRDGPVCITPDGGFGVGFD